MNAQPVEIIVVEDEEILLENMCRKIAAVSPDFEIIGRAYNGKEALAQIRKEQPDIVFTDIRMPVMDGLELAGALNREYPEIHVVIVSGYDDFEYARRALTYRVHDYLLKPLKAEALERLLSSLHVLVTEKRENEMNRLLQRQLSDSVASLSKDSPVDLDRYRFYPFLICLGNLHLQELSRREVMEAAGAEMPAFDELFRKRGFGVSHYWIFPYLADNLYLLLTDAVAMNISELAGYIQDFLRRHFPTVAVNISFPARETAFDELRHTFTALHKQLKSSLVIGKSALFTVWGREGNDGEKAALPPAILPQESVTHVQTVVLSGNSGEFKRLLLRYFSEWERREYPQQWVEKVLSQLLYLLQRNLYFSDETYGEMYRRVFCILESGAEFMKSGEKIAGELVRWISLLQAVPTEIGNTVEELEGFIRKHYRENLNLSELADKYHFNHSYLTKTF